MRYVGHRHVGVAWRSCVTASVMVAAICMAAAGAGAQEMLTNGGFEEPGEQAMPQGWRDNSSWADLDVEYAQDETAPHSGAACLGVHCARLSSGAVQVVPTHPVPLKQGAIYRVSGWVRGERGEAALQLRLAPAPYTVYAEDHIELRPEWQELAYFWTSSVDDPQGRFMIRLTNVGRVWIDDVSVAELPAEQARGLAGEPQPGNLLHNGSFELGVANWLIGHGCDYWREVAMTVEGAATDARLRIEVPEGVSVWLASDVVEVLQGHPLRLSCRLRADRPTSVLLNAAAIWCRQEVGPEWVDVGAEAAVPFEPHPVTHFRMNLSGPVAVWLDDVRLEQASGEDAPRAAAIPDRHPMSLYHEGQTPSLRLMSRGAGEFAWTVTNYGGDTVASGRWTGEPGRVERVRRLAGLARGWYHVAVRWERAGREYVNESTFCLLPPPERTGEVARSPFGAHFAVDDTSLALAKAVGVRWLRLHPPNHTKWRVVEPAPGQWRWRDEPIRKAREAGLELVGSLDRLPAWASSAPEGTAERGFYHGPAAWVPRDWSEWETYVSETIRRYRADIRIWEVWNEPNLTDWLVPTEGQSRAQAYAEMLQHTYPIVKREDPGAVVWGGCIAGALWERSSQLEFADELIAGGGLQYMDVFSFHEYVDRSVDEQTDPLSVWVERLRGRMREAGRALPIVNSEGGFADPGTSLHYRPVSSGTVPADLMARLLVRQHVAQLAAGVERFFFYNFFIDGSPVVRQWEGFVEGDGQPRPNVAAYATMTWLLDGAQFLRTECPDENVWVHHFRTPSGPLAVAWTRTGTTGALRLPGAQAAWDLMGTEVQVRGERPLTLTDAPLYVRLTG